MSDGAKISMNNPNVERVRRSVLYNYTQKKVPIIDNRNLFKIT